MSTSNVNYAAYLNRSVEDYLARFFENPMKDLKTLEGERVFKVSHDKMLAEWRPSTDYQLGVMSKGICNQCCDTMLSMHHPSEVVVQIGTVRFGVRVGICFPCINTIFANGANKYLNIKIPYTSSEDIHEASITIGRLRDLSKRENPLEDSGEETMQPLSPFNKGVLNYIFETHSGLVEQADQERKLPYLCKRCKKIDTRSEKAKENFSLINRTRAIYEIAGMCLACSSRLIIGSGCSMVSCPDCISKTKNCGVCVQWAEGSPDEHNVQTCAAIMAKVLQREGPPLPPLQKCECRVEEVEEKN
jgi:hypothetical protein